jgi:LysR family hydrogen peroxide-inducible transcriptional activator
MQSSCVKTNAKGVFILLEMDCFYQSIDLGYRAMPTLTQLEYVLSVERNRHFGKAAKACHISQPTLSQQIQKLEEELGITIFDRIQKPVIPTLPGRRFLDQARIVIREHERLLSIAAKKDAGLRGEFRLGIIPTVSSHLVPRFVSDFSGKFPGVRLFIDELKTESILEDLRADRLDGAILATPLHKNGLKETPLYYEPFLLYLCRQHPLLKKSQLTPADLDGAEMWMLNDGHCFRTQIVNFCSLAPNGGAVFKNVHFQSGSLDTLRNIVQNNRGYTMIPALMAQGMSAAELQAHVRPFRAPIPTREISLVYRRESWKTEMLHAIAETIMRNLPAELASPKQSAKQIVLEIC